MMNHPKGVAVAAIILLVLGLGLVSNDIDILSTAPTPTEEDHTDNFRALRSIQKFDVSKRVSSSFFATVDHNTHTLYVGTSRDNNIREYKFLSQEQQDVDVMATWGNTKQNGAVYLRSEREMRARGNAMRRCEKNTMDVLAWLMDEVAARGGTLMMTYGGLIHMYREKDFVDENGEYYDDDFDLWASLKTFEMLPELEDGLFHEFGWTVRFMHNGDTPYLITMQIFQVCGHVYGCRGKCKNAHDPDTVSMDVYAFASLPMAPTDKGFLGAGAIEINNENELYDAKCLVQGNKFPIGMIYPTKTVDFKSRGSDKTLHLQVPHDPTGVLQCVYGNWEVPDKGHAHGRLDCTASQSPIV